jgi:integrase
LPDKSKGNIFKVYLSIPLELREHYGKNELKKSTGTRDFTKAKRIQHEITTQWYNEFRTVLGTDNYTKLIKYLLLEDVGYHFREVGDQVFSITFKTRPENAIEAAEAIKGINQFLREYETASEQSDITYFVDRGFIEAQLQNGAKLDLIEIFELVDLVTADFKQQFANDNFVAKRSSSLKVLTGAKKSTYPRPSDFIGAYIGNRKWENNTTKEKQTSLTRIKECLKIIEDPPLDQIIAQHGLKIAETLEIRGLANSTIKGYVTSLSGLIEHIRLYELDTSATPHKPWLTSNPFSSLPLSHYGKKKRSFEALTVDQLHKLFSLKLDPQDRLCLELLITTGCRLDEIALLTWEQIKTDQQNIRYIDLATNARVKNKNSKRLVPIPDIIALPDRLTGRLFSYKIDSDGKASRSAGKILLSKYIHKIRYENDNKKTVHSLRHNFIGFLDNLNPPIAESLKDWITGHGSSGNMTESERKRTYGSDPDLSLKYEAVNRIKHPWL